MLDWTGLIALLCASAVAAGGSVGGSSLSKKVAAVGADDAATAVVAAAGASAVAAESRWIAPRGSKNVDPRNGGGGGEESLRREECGEACAKAAAAAGSPPFAPETVWNAYHTHAEAMAIAGYATEAFPDTIAAFDIGRSVEGRPIYAIRVTDRVREWEVGEPSVRLTANVHGDETAGRELLLRLAIELAWARDNASSMPWDADIAADLSELSGALDVWIVPSANPDGYDAARRENARGVDLNRDFPSPFIDEPDGGKGSSEREVQPETLAYMALSHGVPQFALSLDFHGGALVASYPWDAGRAFGSRAYSAAPDDALFRALASAYADAHATMSRSAEFPGGTTNGARWYPVYRSAQDWSYSYEGTPALTIEIGSAKRPPPAALPAIWDQNIGAIVALLRIAAGRCVSGAISSADASSSDVPADAYVSITRVEDRQAAGGGARGAGGRLAASPLSHKPPIRVNRATHAFSAILLPGTYAFETVARGFVADVRTVIVPRNQAVPIFLDIALAPATTAR